MREGALAGGEVGFQGRKRRIADFAICRRELVSVFPRLEREYEKSVSVHGGAVEVSGVVVTEGLQS